MGDAKFKLIGLSPSHKGGIVIRLMTLVVSTKRVKEPVLEHP